MDNITKTEVGKGASLVGISDTNGNFTATNVEGALAELTARIGAHTIVEDLSITQGINAPEKTVEITGSGISGLLLINRQRANSAHHTNVGYAINMSSVVATSVVEIWKDISSWDVTVDASVAGKLTLVISTGAGGSSTVLITFIGVASDINIALA